MKRTVVILLFLISFLMCSGLSSNIAAQKNTSKTVAPKPTGKPDLDTGVDDVILDKTQVIMWCPTNRGCPKSEVNVEIKTVSKSAVKDHLTYYYIVSGGKIEGQGANVIWNLLDAPRGGYYTLLVGTGNNNLIRGKTITKTITLTGCDCCIVPCSCPTLTVSGPTEPAIPGEAMIFTTDIKGGSQDSITYNWTVSAGTIIYGQGTSQIVVQTTPEIASKNVTATVEIGGLCPECNRTASATGEIAGKKP